MMKNNISWINNLKLLCMVMIYLNHSEIYCGQTIGLLRNIYLPLFVPSFFFISGYLFFMKQLKEPQISLNASEWFDFGQGGGIILNILYKIAIPSILFSTILYLPKKIIRGQSLEWSDFLIETVGGCTYWFTSALAIAELILVLLLLARVKNIWFYVGIGALAAILGHIAWDSDAYFTCNPNFPWFWKSALAAVFYLTLGGLYGKYEDVVDTKIGLENWWVIILLVLAYSCYCLFDFRVYDGGLDSAPITIGSALLSIIGILVIVSVCKKLRSSKFSDYWGRNTIGLYFLCGAIPNTIAVLLGKVMPVGIPMLILCWSFSFAVALIMVYYLNRYMPFLFDLRKFKCYNRNKS